MSEAIVALQKRHSQAETVVPVLLRHRWTGELAFETWVCLPRAIVLEPSISDPICRGCRSTIAFSELDYSRERYPDEAALQLGLDLLFAQLTQQRAEVMMREARCG